MSSSPEGIRSSSIVIVGSGLAGYTTAASLAAAGCEDITVYDGRQDPTMFEIDRAYSQVMYQTGQSLLRKLPGFDEVFKKDAFCQYVRVVCDIAPDGKQTIITSQPPAGPLYWTLKARLLDMLDAYVKQTYPHVKFVPGATVQGIQFVNPQTVENSTQQQQQQQNQENSPSPANTTQRKVMLQIKTGNGGEEDGSENNTQLVEFDALMACDGSKSTIRKLMALHDDQVDSKNGMSIYSRDTPSTGLRHKGIVLDETPIISAPGEAITYAEPSMIYVLHGDQHNRPADVVFDAILLPVSSGQGERRRAAITVVEGHQLLSVPDVDAALALFRANFPQLRVDDLFPREEMETFVKTPASTFPPTQRPMSLVAHFRHTDTPSAVLFVGDSAHSFPPDAAQGTNGAFQDVEALLDIVSGVVASEDTDESKTTTWADIADRYEAARDKETWELVELIGIAAPYQYKQDRIGYARYMLNKKIRSALSSVAPGLFSDDVDTLIRQGMSYRKVHRRDVLTTASLTLLAAAAIAVPVALVRSMARKGEEDDDLGDE